MLDSMASALLDRIITALNLSPGAVVVIFALIVIIYRKRIWRWASEKIRLVAPISRSTQVPVIDSFSDDVKVVVEFGTHLVIPDAEEFASSLDRIINECRETSRLLVLNLVSLADVNECAREAIRAAIKTAIEDNNIRILLVFPSHTEGGTEIDRRIEFLCEDLVEFSKLHSDRSVRIKRDERRGDPR